MHKLAAIIVILFLLCIPMQNSLATKDSSLSFNEHNSTILQYTYTFQKPTLTMIQEENRTFSQILMGDLPLAAKANQPIIPKKPVTILLPYETTIDDITIETASIRTVINTKIRNLLQGPFFQRFDSTFLNNKPEDDPDASTYYPSTYYDVIGVQYQHGYPLLYLNINPVQILREHNTLRYTQAVTVTIETKTSSHSSTPKLWAQNQIIETVDNPEMITSYQQTPDSFHQEHSQTIDYVLITADNLTQSLPDYNYSFQDLIDFRENQGLTCTIQTVESIKDEYEGIDTQEKIRNFIKYAYTHWNTKWVLLGGDVEIVPIRFLKDVDGQEKGETKVASDLYYQCLDGNYNYDNDSHWGEKNDGVNGDRIDLLAEVYLGRAPVDDLKDVSSFVEKTLVYEQQDFDNDPSVSRVLSAGEVLWTGPGGYGAGYVERCIDYCEDYNQETYGIPSDKFSITRLYERDMVWSDDDVMDVINDGVAIINHVGHGTPVSAMKLSTFELEDLENTGKYGLFYTQACHSGQLELHDECFAEKWVNVPQKGGFAAIMDTGYGYGSSINYDGADNRFAREFYDALFSPHEKISQIGVANQDSKEDNLWHIEDGNMYHTYYVTTLFGDPYVTIHGAKEASANFSFTPLYPTTGDLISFEDESEGIISFREWDFGDGTSTQQENPVHVFSSARTYDVSLTVMDNQGYISTKTTPVEVKDYWNPRPKITPESYNGANFTIPFSSAESWDPDGEIVGYLWDFDDNSSSTQPNPVHTFETEGTYSVCLTVEDNDGNFAKAYSTIVISYQMPPVTPDGINGPTAAFSGTNSSFSVQTIDPEGDTIQYGWDWNGDNTVDEWTEYYPSGQECSITHHWKSLGTFSVQVKARDHNYGESNWSPPLTITVSDESTPVVSINHPSKGIYVQNNRLIPFPFTLAIGSVDISVSASDGSGIDKVLFYIDDLQHPVAEVLSHPFTYHWNKLSFRQHTVKVVAFDNAGRHSSVQQQVWKFF